MHILVIHVLFETISSLFRMIYYHNLTIHYQTMVIFEYLFYN